MKFGKLLRESLTEPYYDKSLDYKHLKKVCKRLREHKKQQPKIHSCADMESFPSLLNKQQASFFFFCVLNQKLLPMMLYLQQ
mmetsp:Transcript_21359/g.28022  ORF Transcript_21359/g.28022 Transcript_21359/m.28022 type:complete len:82 (-) Transcript_21359:1278-1523(-)